MKRFAFLGDTSFHDFHGNPDFSQLVKTLSDSSIILNLESSITTQSNHIKDKVCLKQEPEVISFLKELDPFLINIGNNHINDYGNKGVKETVQLLEKDDFEVIGAGEFDTDHNIFVDKKHNIAFFSYVTRETDLSSPTLFETPLLQGPKELSLHLFIKQSERYSDFKKVLLLHWGEEEIRFPLKMQRVKAKELIDAGADLIIGSHAHLFQGYETYNDKYIFYSLGNFFFPDINNNTSKKKQHRRNRFSIIPIFNQELGLENIITVCHNKDNDLQVLKNNKKVEKLSKRMNSKYYQQLVTYEFLKRDTIKGLIRKVRLR
jgi:poly-gamma-glutamate capsule biosynthesis protein CapA/YwtB (metallophosphatase superfamily)